MNILIKKAFTLIELLVVIVIIGILSGFIVISIKTAVDSANDNKIKTTAASIVADLEVYKNLNGGKYPIEITGCNIGPVGTLNRCINLAAVLTDTLYGDSISGYYSYYSQNGSDFTLSAKMSTETYLVYSASSGYYNSIVARAPNYSKRNIITNVVAYVDDSANGASLGYVANFPNGWRGTTYISKNYGFTPGTYDMYMRVRTDGLGNYPTSFSSVGVWNSTDYITLKGFSVTGLTNSYKVIYVGRFTIVDKLYYTWFSSSGVTTNYYIDYIEFRPVSI